VFRDRRVPTEQLVLLAQELQALLALRAQRGQLGRRVLLVLPVQPVRVLPEQPVLRERRADREPRVLPVP